jgi:hypothetical protein
MEIKNLSETIFNLKVMDLNNPDQPMPSKYIPFKLQQTVLP